MIEASAISLLQSKQCLSFVPAVDRKAALRTSFSHPGEQMIQKIDPLIWRLLSSAGTVYSHCSTYLRYLTCD